MSAASSVGRLATKLPNKRSASSPALVARLAAAKKPLTLRGNRSTVDIISPKLCDDVIDRMAPSLARHAGCDIVDVNPGVGLWSAKLHQHLKPRTHILVEPEQQLYLPFLQSLLDQPGSRYRNLPLPGVDRATFDCILADGLLPEQELLRAGDPRLSRPNDSLLFVANLAYYPVKRTQGFPSVPHLMIHRLLSAIRAQSWFHAYGQVRMLLWMTDGEKRMLLPRTVGDRRKYTMEAEISCDKVFEVVGADGGPGQNRREKEVEVQSAVRVLNSMRERGVVVPPSRKSQMLRDAEEAASKSASDANSLSAAVPKPRTQASEGRSWHAELEGLQRRFREGEFSRYQGPGKKKRGEARDLTAEYARLEVLQHLNKSQTSRAGKAERLVERSDALRALEEEALDDSLPPADLEDKRKKLASASSALAGEVRGLPKQVRDLAALIQDDRRAFQSQPPLLMWDRRTDEPLTVGEAEFAPRTELALVDIHPKALAPALGASSESASVYDYMVGSLFAQPKQSVVKGIANLAPGAAEALIPQVPALGDPKRGGSRKVEDLTVRLLTPEMLEGLVQAWQAWPFRLSKVEMITRMGSDIARFKEID